MGRDCEKQEERYQFDHFTRGDALRLGLKLNENAQEYSDPVAIEITLNGLTVFRYMPEGTTADNALWLRRKRASVDLTQISSLHFASRLEANGETLEDHKLDPCAYAACGGGFPILLRGTGAVGSICVSGLPHLDDHRLVIDTLAEFLSVR